MAETTPKQVMEWRVAIERLGSCPEFDMELDLPLLLLDAAALHQLEPEAAALTRIVKDQAARIQRLERKLAAAKVVIGNVSEAIGMWRTPLDAMVRKIEDETPEPGS